MKIEHIIEAISKSVGSKVFDEWHHEGSIQYVDDDWLSIEIDGDLYYVMVMQKAPKDAEPEVLIEEAPAEEEPVTVQAEEPGKEEPKQRKKIDHQKIRSLHNAGWTNKQIADEMHLTSTQISQSLSRSKKQMEAEE